MSNKFNGHVNSYNYQDYPYQSSPNVPRIFLPVDYYRTLAHDVIQCAVDRPCIGSVYNVGANLIIEWSDTEHRDHYNFRWSRPGRQDTQIEVPGDRGGSFTLRNFWPNTRYTFKVQGCHKAFLAPSRCTPWEETTVVSCGAQWNPCR